MILLLACESSDGKLLTESTPTGSDDSISVLDSDSTTTDSVPDSVPNPPGASYVILFIGDGLSLANRTAARMLSKGIKEGRYYGQLSFDDMPHMALIGTSGVDSIITDSANAMINRL